MADQIERWSEELARDPTSGVFIPLADALRRRGQLDLAARVATRGLSRRPYDGDAHDLLARIWADRGDVQRAMDEWSMALKCAPTHPGALKGMGFACYQIGQMTDAERYLVEAAAADPDDASIRSALARLRRPSSVPATPRPTESVATHAVAGNGKTPVHVEPVVVEEPAVPSRNGVAEEGTDGADWSLWAAVAGAPSEPTTVDAGDPRCAFDNLLGSGEQTALVVDGDGLVVAGRYVIADGRDVAEDVGAALSGVGDEARRAMRHLNLGSWTSLVFETADAAVAMAPVPPAAAVTGALSEPDGADRAPIDGLALVAAGRSVPLGMVRQLLVRVVERATLWIATGGPGPAL